MASDADKHVHGLYDSRGLLYAMYDSPSGSNKVVKQARSDDDGQTWGATATVFTSQTYTMQPRLAELADGGILRCAFVPDLNTDGTPKSTGRLIGCFQASGERIDDVAHPLPEFFLRDDLGQTYAGSVDLKLQNSGYDIIAPGEEPDRFYLSATVAGGSGNTGFLVRGFRADLEKDRDADDPPG